MNHFVAIGDSFTEGIGDPAPVGAASPHPGNSNNGGLAPIPLRSAHDWLALWMQKTNPQMQYTNLAERGLRVAEIRSQQMQRGLGLRPNLVSIIAGANDCLRGPFNAEALKAELSLMFGAFESIGSRLFTATLPNFTLQLALPEAISARMRRNLETTNAIITELATEYGAIFFDFWNLEAAHNPQWWSEDGVHPNALGYLETARYVAPLLRQHGIVVGESD